MQTNGCTMTYGKGGLGTCERHLRMTREVCDPHLRSSPKLAPSNAMKHWRKHGGYKHDRPLPGMVALPKVEGPRVLMFNRTRGTAVITSG